MKLLISEILESILCTPLQQISTILFQLLGGGKIWGTRNELEAVPELILVVKGVTLPL